MTVFLTSISFKLKVPNPQKIVLTHPPLVIVRDILLYGMNSNHPILNLLPFHVVWFQFTQSLIMPMGCSVVTPSVHIQRVPFQKVSFVGLLISHARLNLIRVLLIQRVYLESTPFEYRNHCQNYITSTSHCGTCQVHRWCTLKVPHQYHLLMDISYLHLFQPTSYCLLCKGIGSYPTPSCYIIPYPHGLVSTHPISYSYSKGVISIPPLSSYATFSYTERIRIIQF